MAFSLSRSVALVARRAAMPAGRGLLQQGGVVPRTAFPRTPWQVVLPGAAAHTRTVITTIKYTRADVLEKLDAYEAEVLSANWADYLYLVYNEPFWAAEMESLTTLVQPYLHEPEVGEQFARVQEMTDVLYKCEDVRDHLNELAELATRASGLMGTGYGAEEKVENVQEHAKLCSEAYDALLKAHPSFKPKIEQTVGHGLAILRSKHKFNFSSMYRYFY